MALSLSQDNVGEEDGEKDSEKIFIRRAIRVGAMRLGCNSDDGDGWAILRRWPLSVPCTFAFPRNFFLLRRMEGTVAVTTHR